MAIQLTERAAAEVKRIMQDQQMDAATLLRVGVQGGGCSGFSYSLNFDTNSDDAADSTYEFHGVQVVVDRKSASLSGRHHRGFLRGLDKRGFTFDNPNAVKSCGCGSSFQA